MKMWSESLFLFLLLLVALSAVGAGECPDLYRRFSLNHTYCLPANTTCVIMNRGVTSKEKQYILQLHNEYRSKVATGKETEADGLPPAAAMLEMVWDEELAAIAQKHAETCKYAHDGNNDRRVQSFSVGQNIGVLETNGMPPLTADWHRFLKSIYNEVIHFNNSFIKPYHPGPEGDKQYGHFTQMIWASSWRIGCGWTLFKDGDLFSTTSYKVCNYGPGGNLVGGAIYEAGPACSACPMNSCCEDDCKEHNITAKYPGLCKVIQESMSPGDSESYESGNYSFYCDFNDQPDCKVKYKGKPWMMVRTPGGNWMSNILHSGEITKLNFTKSIEIGGNLCFVLYVRSGPNVDGENISGKGVSIFHFSSFKSKFKLKNNKKVQEFVKNTYILELSEGKRYQFQFLFYFYVPKGSAPQFVEIRKLFAKEC